MSAADCAPLHHSNYEFQISPQTQFLFSFHYLRYFLLHHREWKRRYLRYTTPCMPASFEVNARTFSYKRCAGRKVVFQFKRSWNTLYTITTSKWKESCQPGSLWKTVIVTKPTLLSFHFTSIQAQCRITDFRRRNAVDYWKGRSQKCYNFHLMTH